MILKQSCVILFILASYLQSFKRLGTDTYKEQNLVLNDNSGGAYWSQRRCAGWDGQAPLNGPFQGPIRQKLQTQELYAVLEDACWRPQESDEGYHCIVFVWRTTNLQRGEQIVEVTFYRKLRAYVNPKGIVSRPDLF